MSPHKTGHGLSHQKVSTLLSHRLVINVLFLASTPSTVPFTSEVAVLSNRPVLHPPVQSVESDEVGKPDKDSVDGDQPDSGIEEVDSTKEVHTCQLVNIKDLFSLGPYKAWIQLEKKMQKSSSQQTS